MHQIEVFMRMNIKKERGFFIYVKFDPIVLIDKITLYFVKSNFNLTSRFFLILRIYCRT